MLQQHHLHEAAFFYRHTGDGYAMIGAVLVPHDMQGEKFHLLALKEKADACFVLDGMQESLNQLLNPLHQHRLDDLHKPQESDLGHLLTQVWFRQLQPTGVDASTHPCEALLRDCPLPSNQPDLKWMLCISAAFKPPGFFRGDGLYVVHPGRDMQVDLSCSMGGEAIAQVLRQPLWGHGNQYGLASSMRPDVAPQALAQMRADAARRDPLYAEFLRHAPDQLPPFYTRAQYERIELESARIVRWMLDQDRDRDGLQEMTRQRPRP